MINEFLKKNKRPYIIAEVSQNHDGSLGQAHAFIDAIKEAGADAVKFQTHIADEESSAYEPFRVKFSYEDDTRMDYWRRMEFTEEQWIGLYKHAKSVGLDFLSSPFSEKALDMLDRIGIPAWKFGSGEIFNDILLDKAVKTGKPIFLSTGLCTWDELKARVDKVKKNSNELLLFQCVTAYPSTPDMIDIKMIERLRQEYDCLVGISDHSATIYPALAATTLGAVAVEVHVTFSHKMFGPDVKASVDMQGLRDIVEGTNFIAKMLRADCNMDYIDDSKRELRSTFSKSLFSRMRIEAGETITEKMVALRKPNIGIDSSRFSDIIGKTAARCIEEGTPIRWEDLK